MIIQCPACQSRYRVKSGQVPKPVVRVKCPGCGHGFEVALKQDEPPALNPRTVLVVDDARFFREVILDILAPLGLNLLTAADGEEALEVLHRERPALVLLDLRLPGLDGYGLIRAMRADAKLGGIRILAMSSVYRQDDEVRKILLAGADEFLNKSFSPAQLQARIQKLLPDAG